MRGEHHLVVGLCPALVPLRGVVPDQLHLDPLPVPGVPRVMLIADHGEILHGSVKEKISNDFDFVFPGYWRAF